MGVETALVVEGQVRSPLISSRKGNSAQHRCVRPIDAGIALRALAQECGFLGEDSGI